MKGENHFTMFRQVVLGLGLLASFSQGEQLNVVMISVDDMRPELAESLSLKLKRGKGWRDARTK